MAPPTISSCDNGYGTSVADPKLFSTVPVPAPYLDHKKHSFQKQFWKNIAFFTVSFFQGKN
jgi:hypothetical protein